MIESLGQIEMYCEQLLSRIDNINRLDLIPSDMITCLSSLIFSAGRVPIEELEKIKFDLNHKYGPAWIEGCQSNSNATVDPNLYKNLMSLKIKNELIKEKLHQISNEQHIEWNSSILLPEDTPLTKTEQKIPENKIETNKNQFQNQIQNQTQNKFQTKISSKTYSNPQFSLSLSEEQTILIEMLPYVPSNTDITMEFLPLATDGGIIVTYDASEKKIDEENFDSITEIPDEPFFENEIYDSVKNLSTINEKNTDDLLFERLKKLQNK